MKKDTIYDNLNMKVTEQEFDYFFKNSYYTREELSLVEKIAYSMSQVTFQKLFQMMRMNIIQPLNLTEITNFNSEALSSWVDKKIEDAHLFDYQNLSLNALLEIDKALNPLPTLFARNVSSNNSIKDFLFAFDYYNIANTDNSYKTKINFIDDFKTKMGLNDPTSELNTLVANFNSPLDFSEINNAFLESTLTSLYSKLFTEDIIGGVDEPGIFTVERLHDLCFCSSLNLSTIQIYRDFFTDLINWKFPYNNFNDIREFLGNEYMKWHNSGESLFSPYETCQEEISNILNKEGRISFYEFNRALVFLCYIENTEKAIGGIENLITLFNNTLFNKIEIINQILNFIKNNVYAIKYINI